jgi:hypothetical protein
VRADWSLTNLRFTARDSDSEDPDVRLDPIRHIEELLCRWASAQGKSRSLASGMSVQLTRCLAGVTLDLRLPDHSLLTPYTSLSEPDLPGNPESWQNLFATFLVKCQHHRDLLLPNQAEQLFERFLREPGTLKADEMALVLSILALGRQSESQLRSNDTNDIEEEVAFYKLALSALERCEQASQTGIRELKTPPRLLLPPGPL